MMAKSVATEKGPADIGTPVAPIAHAYLAVRVMSLANRLNRGASSFYQRRFGIAMVDYRIVMALGLVKGLNISEVAAAADIDKAAASRSLRDLEKRGMVELEQTATRGRAAIVHLTEEGKALARELKKSSRLREQRLVEALTADELTQVTALVQKLIDGVPNMNKD
jgi:DNA-binding MarR family transcriptional regulator